MHIGNWTIHLPSIRTMLSPLTSLHVTGHVLATPGRSPCARPLLQDVLATCEIVFLVIFCVEMVILPLDIKGWLKLPVPWWWFNHGWLNQFVLSWLLSWREIQILIHNSSVWWHFRSCLWWNQWCSFQPESRLLMLFIATGHQCTPSGSTHLGSVEKHLGAIRASKWWTHFCFCAPELHSSVSFTIIHILSISIVLICTCSFFQPVVVTFLVQVLAMSLC